MSNGIYVALIKIPFLVPGRWCLTKENIKIRISPLFSGNPDFEDISSRNQRHVLFLGNFQNSGIDKLIASGLEKNICIR